MRSGDRLLPPERVSGLIGTMWRIPNPPDPVLLANPAVREIARLLAKRLDEAKVYGAGGCPTCHDAEAQAFLAQLRKLGTGDRDGCAPTSSAAWCRTRYTVMPGC